MVLNNKRGQTVVTFFFVVLVFIIMWIGFLGKYLNMIGQQAISTGATGLEAWAYGNLNLFVFIGLMLLIIMYNKFG